MTQELLNKARRDYPEGTQYRSAGGSPTIYIIKVDEKTYQHIGEEDIDAGFGMGYLYCHGRWAEIIKPVEIPVINNYSIY